MVKSCSAYGCQNVWYQNCGLHFHGFPFQRPDVLAKWIHVMRRKNFRPTKSSYLCSEHFSFDSYKESSYAQHFLNNDAVPSIFNFPEHLRLPTKIPKRELVQRATKKLPVEEETVFPKFIDTSIQTSGSLQMRADMSTADEADPPAKAMNPNPEGLKKNLQAIKDAQEQTGTLDVLVCGQCHSVYHFIEEFIEHRDAVACSGKSPVRDCTESKHQVWAFILWKCSMVTPETGANSSWRLYQQWCKMDEKQRAAWIAAGKTVQNLSKLANSKVNDEEFQPSSTEDSDDETAIKIEEIRSNRSRVISSVKTTDTEEDGKTSIIKKLGSSVTVTETSAKTPVLETQASVPIKNRMARRTDKNAAADVQNTEFVIEKILAKRFNLCKKQYEYLLKWEGYPHEQNTWELADNMDTCRHLLEIFERQLARQIELKALRNGQSEAPTPEPAPVPVPILATPTTPAAQQPMLTPSGRLQRYSKARAMDKVKAWCGADVSSTPITAPVPSTLVAASVAVSKLHAVSHKITMTKSGGGQK